MMNNVERRLFYQRLGDRIRLSREVRGMTQVEMSRALKISRPSLANIEAGRQGIAVHSIIEIARVLGVTIRTLVGS